MPILAAGRVVGEGGHPVAGATVFLYRLGESCPVPGNTGPADRLSAVTDDRGEYVVGEGAADDAVRRSTDMVVRAVHGTQISGAAVVRRRGKGAPVRDLVLQPGVPLAVQVTWDDGGIAQGVHVRVFLQGPGREGAPYTEYCTSVEAETDEFGLASIGYVQDQPWHTVVVRASRMDTPEQARSWNHVRLDGDVLRTTIARGHTVRGRLCTPDGRPAAGYRVAAYNDDEGDPRGERIVTVAENGEFVVGSAGPGASLAVYPPVSVFDGTPESVFRSIFAGAPVCFIEIPEGVDDVGTVDMAAHHEITVMLTDRDGAPFVGRVSWRRADRHHGYGDRETDEHGIVTFGHVPVGAPLLMEVGGLGAPLRQEFEIPADRTNEVELRVTGAGTVLLRLHPAGAPDEPLTARLNSALFDT